VKVLIVGAGIGGLTTALGLHAAGIDVDVIDAVRELRPLGVGINLLPHATRELTDLGLADALAGIALSAESFAHFDRHGDRVWGEARGLAAGYRWPQYSVHRGRLQMLLLAAVRERLGPHAVRTGTAFVDFADGPGEVTARLRDQATGEEYTVAADALEPVNAIVLANRGDGSDVIMDMVTRRAPDGFDRVDEVLLREELARLAGGYRSISHTGELTAGSPWRLPPRRGHFASA
jgi:flavin-dependent dehydrogenase